MPTYTFKLFIEKEKSQLSLLEDGEVGAHKEWPEERDMGRRLFEAIAALLEKNKLQPEQVSAFVVESELSDTSTSMRIAETVKRVYAFGTASSASDVSPGSGDQKESAPAR